MKKTQVALAALALVASTAALADVKVAGCVDATVVSTKAGTVLGGAGDGCASQFGLYASEDMGAGLTASVNLETGFSTNNGTLGNGGSAGNASAVFNRKANVGVGTKEATITLGLAKSAWIEAAGGGLTAYGMNGVGVPALAILNPNLSGTSQSGGFFVGNLVGVSGDLGMFNYNLQTTVNKAGNKLVSAAPDATDPSTLANQTVGTNDSFSAARFSTNLGGAALNLGYESRKNTTGLTASNGTTFVAADVDYTNMVVSVSYAVTSQLSINGAYAKQRAGSADTAGNTTHAGYVLGTAYKLADNFGVGVTYARNNVDNANVSMTALSAQYDLSKRTAIYANVADFKNATVLNNGGNAEAPTAAAPYGKTLFAVGMQHAF